MTTAAKPINVVGQIGNRSVPDLVIEINRLAAEAEDLLTQLDRTPECQAVRFRSLIASQVQELVEAVSEDPRLADDVEFGDLVPSRSGRVPGDRGQPTSTQSTSRLPSSKRSSDASTGPSPSVTTGVC